MTKAVRFSQSFNRPNLDFAVRLTLTSRFARFILLLYILLFNFDIYFCAIGFAAVLTCRLDFDPTLCAIDLAAILSRFPRLTFLGRGVKVL